jgi:hypothetical protein
MEKQSCVLIFSAIIYLISLGIFYLVEISEFDCDDQFEHLCIHLCTTGNEKFSDAEIQKKLDNYEGAPIGFSESNHIYRSNLKCLSMKVVEKNGYRSFEDGDVDADNELMMFFKPEKYCLEFLPDESHNETEQPWIMHVCDKNYTAQKIFHGFGENFQILKASSFLNFSNF